MNDHHATNIRKDPQATTYNYAVRLPSPLPVEDALRRLPIHSSFPPSFPIGYYLYPSHPFSLS